MLTVGNADAVIVAEMILGHRQSIFPDAECGRPGAIFPADRVNRCHLITAGYQPLIGESLHCAAVEKTVGELATASRQVVGIIGENTRHAKS